MAADLHLLLIMYRACIALVDATRARLFALDRVSDGADTYEELAERTVPRELVKLSPADMRVELSSQGLLPPRAVSATQG
jgi:hypothetical protein